MGDFCLTHNLRDKGGRRTSIERRRFTYSEHIPERRSGEDRRVSEDRRCGMDRRNGREGRSRIECMTKF
jgi:hypothetical protein